MARKQEFSIAKLANEIATAAAHDGTVTPALWTAGGHARWDLDDLRAQLAALRRRDE